MRVVVSGFWSWDYFFARARRLDGRRLGRFSGLVGRWSLGRNKRLRACCCSFGWRFSSKGGSVAESGRGGLLAFDSGEGLSFGLEKAWETFLAGGGDVLLGAADFGFGDAGSGIEAYPLVRFVEVFDPCVGIALAEDVAFLGRVEFVGGVSSYDAGGNASAAGEQGEGGCVVGA